MIVIRYSAWRTNQEKWKEKLEDLIVGHRFEKDNSLSDPELHEQEKTICGEAAIEAFLIQLERDINDWRTPRCGV